MKLLISKYYAELYSIICRIYLGINRYIFNNQYYFGFGATSITTLFLYIATSSIANSAFGTIIVALILFCIQLFLKFIILNIQPSGVSERFIFPGKYIQINSNGTPSQLITEGIQTEYFEFASKITASIAAELNVQAYARTAWQASYDEKFKRNLSHIQRNKHSILLIKSSRGEYIGFTHVLPVTRNTWDKYNKGLIKDKNYSAKLIANNEKKTLGSDAYGIIIFSVACIKRNRDFKESSLYASSVGELLEQALVHHVRTLCREYFKGTEEVPVLLQNMGEEFLKFFKPAATSTTNISADGVRIIAFEIFNSENNNFNNLTQEAV